MGEEDAKAKERIDAKNGLGSYCYSMKNTISEDKFKSAVSEEDTKQIQDKLDEVMQWLETAEHAEKEEFESMQKELGETCNPILAKMHQGSTQAEEPVVNPAGGPTIEEVD